MIFQKVQREIEQRHELNWEQENFEKLRIFFMIHIVPCSGESLTVSRLSNNNKTESVHIQYKYDIFKNIFNLQMVESMDAESVGMEGRQGSVSSLLWLI